MPIASLVKTVVTDHGKTVSMCDFQEVVVCRARARRLDETFAELRQKDVVYAFAVQLPPVVRKDISLVAVEYADDVTTVFEN